MLDKFTVTIRGEDFTLYRDQIEFDAPNYFSDLFLGDFSESQTRRVELTRSPELFRAIVDYMSGYTILPLTPAVVPATMTSDSALENLLRDAEFYGLRGLVALLQPQVTVSKTWSACQGFALADQVVDLWDLLRGGELANGILCDERGVGCLRKGTWHPVLIKASGMVVENNSDGWVYVTLTEPLLHEKLVSAFRDRGTLLQTRTCDVDGHRLYAIGARILPSAPIIVEGIETAGKIFVDAMSQASRAVFHPAVTLDDLTRAMIRVKDHGGLYNFMFVAEDIFFTIRSKAADLYGDSSIEVCILAARLISRTAAARRML